VNMLAAHVEDGVRPGGWLFIGAGDGPPGKNQVWYRWHKTTNAAGVEGIKLHDLRHFYASGFIAAGCDVVTVQRALGHSSATTTLNNRAY
jgi:integrase